MRVMARIAGRPCTVEMPPGCFAWRSSVARQARRITVSATREWQRATSRRSSGSVATCPVVSKSREDLVNSLGFIGAFFSLDVPASSVLTQRRLGWEPVNPTLLQDLEGSAYF
jgi:hypothetical protein